jgi:hypothetical protein
MDWTLVALDRVRLREYLNAIMDFGSIKYGEYLD